MKEGNLRKRYLVILADRERSRFFTIYLGNFESQSQEIISKDVPQKVKAVSGRAGKIERHIRDHLLKHLKIVGHQVLRYLVDNRIRQLDGIFIGTHRELFSDVVDNLPSKLRRKVKGRFVIADQVSVGEIIEKVITKFKL